MKPAQARALRKRIAAELPRSRRPAPVALDSVAAERSKSDWTPPSKHPLSGFTHCFDPEHVPGIIATLDVLRRIGTYGAPK